MSGPGNCDCSNNIRSIRHGFTLTELMIVLTIIGVLSSFAVPSFRRSMQQSRADVAGANLQSIWSAQRLYWLEYRTYATDLTLLADEGLLEPSVSANIDYTFTVEAADNVSFEVRATRINSDRWAGNYSIDEDGNVTGVVSATGENDLSPGYL
jgi:prepilin-type N-terminal cleavage/methylation domain-containing protein